MATLLGAAALRLVTPAFFGPVERLDTFLVTLATILLVDREGDFPGNARAAFLNSLANPHRGKLGAHTRNARITLVVQHGHDFGVF